MKNILNPCPTCQTHGTCYEITHTPIQPMVDGIYHNAVSSDETTRHEKKAKHNKKYEPVDDTGKIEMYCTWCGKRLVKGRLIKLIRQNI